MAVSSRISGAGVRKDIPEVKGIFSEHAVNSAAAIIMDDMIRFILTVGDFDASGT